VFLIGLSLRKSVPTVLLHVAPALVWRALLPSWAERRRRSGPALRAVVTRLASPYTRVLVCTQVALSWAIVPDLLLCTGVPLVACAVLYACLKAAPSRADLVDRPALDGALTRCTVRPSLACRVLSPIHSPFNGLTRLTSSPRTVLRIGLPLPSVMSTVSIEVVSHGRALNAYGFEVSAPTGHRSTLFPANSVALTLST
jgi:hypothetical protein